MIGKQLRTILILLLAVVLLAVGFVVIKNTIAADTPAEEETTRQKNEYLLEDADKDSIAVVDVYTAGEKSYRVYREPTTDSLLLEGYENGIYENSFASLFSALRYITVIEPVEDPHAPEEYGIKGLESSTGAIVVTLRTGEVRKVYVGDLLVSGGAYYCMREGDGTVYAVASSVSTVFNDKTTLIAKTLALPIESNNYYFTTGFKLYKSGELFTAIDLVPEEERAEGDAFALYRMNYPAAYTPSSVAYDEVLQILAAPSADSVVTFEITDENLEKYGFLTPSYEVYYENGDTERRLIFGNVTSDGNIYVLSTDFAFIGLVNIETGFPFLKWDLVEFVNGTVIPYNIDYVRRITVAYENGIDTYALDGKGQALAVTNEKTGEKPDTHNFRQFYRCMLLASMQGYAESTDTSDWLLTMTLELANGKIEEYKFYRISTRKCYYTINGEGEFYVSMDNVEKIINNARRLAAGETVNADAQY